MGLAFRSILTWTIWKPIWLITMPFWLPLSWLWEGVRHTILPPITRFIGRLGLALRKLLTGLLLLLWRPFKLLVLRPLRWLCLTSYLAFSGLAGAQNAPLLAGALARFRAAPRSPAPSLGVAVDGMAGTLARLYPPAQATGQSGGGSTSAPANGSSDTPGTLHNGRFRHRHPPHFKRRHLAGTAARLGSGRRR
ncbi:MAG: hypothetical protein M5U34_19065 [Chloroflexi bacterium]|nr:hypothetical protein [Chloroflexota bacterium]